MGKESRGPLLLKKKGGYMMKQQLIRSQNCVAECGMCVGVYGNRDKNSMGSVDE